MPEPESRTARLDARAISNNIRPVGAYDYLAEKRQALAKWGDHLSRLVAKAGRPSLRLVRSGAAS